MKCKTILYIGNKLAIHGINPTGVDELGARLEKKFSIIRVSDKKNRLLRLAEMLWCVWHHRKRTCVILIDTYSSANFYYVVAVAAVARQLKVPYIPILHGGELPHRLQKSSWLCKKLFSNASINVAPSGYLQSVFEKEGYKVKHIPNSIDIDEYPFTLRERVRPRFLYVRAFSRLYNPILLLEAFAKIEKRHPEAKLCMVGPDKDGTIEQVQQRCRELGVDGKVTFLGKLSKTEWHALSHEYDVFVNPTNADNTPLSVIEAMALGLPVISTAVGGIPWLIKDGKEGLLIFSRSVDAMTAAMERLLSNPELVVMLSRNGRKKVESFDWEYAVCDQWMELLRNQGCSILPTTLKIG